MALPQLVTRLAGRLAAILPIQSSAGSGDAEKVVATDASGLIDLSFLPPGTGPVQRSIIASEALAADDLVNVWDNSGTPNVRKADANSAGKQAHGYVLASVSMSDTATVYFNGVINGLTGLTPGAYQWLSDTAGQMTETPPTGSGTLSQIVGVAVDDDAVVFAPFEPVTLAA